MASRGVGETARPPRAQEGGRPLLRASPRPAATPRSTSPEAGSAGVAGRGNPSPQISTLLNAITFARALINARMSWNMIPSIIVDVIGLRRLLEELSQA